MAIELTRLAEATWALRADPGNAALEADVREAVGFLVGLGTRGRTGELSNVRARLTVLAPGSFELFVEGLDGPQRPFSEFVRLRTRSFGSGWAGVEVSTPGVHGWIVRSTALYLLPGYECRDDWEVEHARSQ